MPHLLPLAGGEQDPPTITLADLQSIVTRYRNERFNLLDPVPPATEPVDSTSVWISKEKIEDFFTGNPTASGIRFYFGVVDDPEVPAGIHNLVLIGTNANSVDMLGDNDTVMVTKNFDIVALGDEDTVICPPPLDRCMNKALLQ